MNELESIFYTNKKFSLSGLGMSLKLPNLKNHTWRVGISPWTGLRPECMYNRTCDPGLELEFLETIARLLNVDLEFIESDTTGCGNVDSNGMWSGLMGMLQRGVIDMTGNNCAVDKWRLEQKFAVNSFPIIQDKQHFLIKLPDTKFGFDIGLPFQLTVWVSIIAVWLLFFMVMTVALSYYLEISSNRAVRIAFSHLLTYMSNTDSENSRQRVPFRFLTSLFVCFFGMFASIYSMYITGILLRPLSVKRPFESSEQLAKSLFNGEYKLVDYRSKVSYPMCYGETCDLLVKAIDLHGYKHVKLGENAQDSLDFLNSILTSKQPLVFVQTKQYVDFYLKDFPDKGKFWLYQDELVGEKWYTFYFRRNFAYQSLFNSIIILFGDFKTNLFKRHWQATKFVRQEKKIVFEIKDKASIGLHALAQPILWYFVATVGAIVVFSIEIWSKKSKNLNCFNYEKF